MGMDESARSTIIEMLTRRDALRPYEVTLLQSGLKHFGLYDGPLDGSFRDGTAKGAAAFFAQDNNKHLLMYASEETRNAVKTYSDNLQKAADASRGTLDGLLETIGLKDKPAPVANPYRDLFGNNPRPLENEREGKGLHTVMEQPYALVGEDIRALQQGLKIPGADGLFGRTTSIQLTRHLTAHPEDWAKIGTPLLNLAMSDHDNRNRLNDVPKSQEYYDRVSTLIEETRGLRGTNAQTYELQVLLNAGGFYRNDQGERSFSTPDGGPGRDTDRAISTFERERPRRRADAGGPDVDADTQLAQSGTGGMTPDKSPVADAGETVRLAAAPAPFKPPMG